MVDIQVLVGDECKLRCERYEVDVVVREVRYREDGVEFVIVVDDSFIPPRGWSK